jgi:DNA (cytosine-5)-methyltransferase 1
MPPIHREKVQRAQQQGRSVGTIYRRIRTNEVGEKAQVAEIRFDGVSGCLRTGSGGSSKQFIFLVEGERLRSRLLSPREAARLMGLPETYLLPDNYSDAYHLLGDGLVVPVVAWLEHNLLSPLLQRGTMQSIKAFVGQNLEEIGNFARQQRTAGLRRLIETYNVRVEAVDPDPALRIEIPPNLAV